MARITEDNRLQLRVTARVAGELMQLLMDHEFQADFALQHGGYEPMEDDFEVPGITYGMIRRWAKELREHELDRLGITEEDVAETRYDPPPGFLE